MVEAALSILGALLTLAVLYFKKRGATDDAARVQAEALRVAETTRRESLEKAADAERRARSVELDVAISEVRTPDDAVRLRERLSRDRANRSL